MKYICYVSTVIVICVYSCLIPRLLCRRDLLSLKMITLEMILQNILCIITSAFFNSTISQLILLYKEMIFYGAVILYLCTAREFKIRKNSLPLLCMLIFCIPYFFIGNASLYTKLICFRQIMTPIILMLYGRSISITEEELNIYVKFLIKIGIAMVIFGIIEEFIIGDAVWFNLHIEKYMEMKGFSKWVYANGLPGNFYSADLYLVFGMLRRMVSIVADPLLTGHFLALCIIILLYNNLIKNRLSYILILAILTLGVIFTLSKGAILVIAIGYVYKVWKKNRGAALLFGISGFIIILYMIKNNTLYTIAQHTGGIVASLGNIMGQGLGSAGNYSNLYDNASSSVAESYFGALLGQMGLIGFVLFLFVLLFYIKQVLKKNKSVMARSIVAYILGITVEAFVSESSINFIGSGVAFIMFGILTNTLNPKKEEEETGIQKEEVKCLLKEN